MIRPDLVPSFRRGLPQCGQILTCLRLVPLHAGELAAQTLATRMPLPGCACARGENMDKLLHVDVDGWLAEVPSIREHFAKFGSHLPEGMNEQMNRLERRVKAANK